MLLHRFLPAASLLDGEGFGETAAGRGDLGEVVAHLGDLRVGQVPVHAGLRVETHGHDVAPQDGVQFALLHDAGVVHLGEVAFLHHVLGGVDGAVGRAVAQPLLVHVQADVLPEDHVERFYVSAH